MEVVEQMRDLHSQEGYYSGYVGSILAQVYLSNVLTGLNDKRLEEPLESVGAVYPVTRKAAEFQLPLRQLSCEGVLLALQQGSVT